MADAAQAYVPDGKESFEAIVAAADRLDPERAKAAQQYAIHLAIDATASDRAQRFFSTLAAEMRKPSYGEMSAGWMRALLTRAEEAKLYDPSKET